VRPFKFRAEAALELRRRRDEEAQRALALARAAVRMAEDARRDVQRTVERARAEGARCWHASPTIDQLVWQRNWMAGLERDVARAEQALDARRTEERRAAENAQQARMDVRVLERLKERNWRTWQQAARRADQKAIDELASLRFAARARAIGE
jgi:flagellar export protein FliJ